MCILYFRGQFGLEHAEPGWPVCGFCGDQTREQTAYSTPGRLCTAVGWLYTYSKLLRYSTVEWTSMVIFLYPQLMKLGVYTPGVSRWSVRQAVGMLVKCCVPTLPQLSNDNIHVNETCYTWPLWRVDVHDKTIVRPGQRIQELFPFF